MSQNTWIPVDQLGAEHVFRIHQLRDIEIEYVYQPDGSRDFTKGELQPRTITLKTADFNRGFSFDKGAMTTGSFGTPEGRCDISYRDFMGKPSFTKHVGHVGGSNSGFYDADKVPFELVKEADADERKYLVPPAHRVPATLDHVYVVKTLDGKYAKFIVRKFVK